MEVDGQTQPLQCVNTTYISNQQVNVTTILQWEYQLYVPSTDTVFFAQVQLSGFIFLTFTSLTSMHQ